MSAKHRDALGYAPRIAMARLGVLPGTSRGRRIASAKRVAVERDRQDVPPPSRALGYARQGEVSEEPRRRRIAVALERGSSRADSRAGREFRCAGEAARRLIFQRRRGCPKVAVFIWELPQILPRRGGCAFRLRRRAQSRRVPLHGRGKRASGFSRKWRGRRKVAQESRFDWKTAPKSAPKREECF